MQVAPANRGGAKEDQAMTTRRGLLRAVTMALLGVGVETLRRALRDFGRKI